MMGRGKRLSFAFFQRGPSFSFRQSFFLVLFPSPIMSSMKMPVVHCTASLESSPRHSKSESVFQ